MSDSVISIDPLDYGVLPSGFARMRLPEIRQAIIDSLQSNTGLTFETRPDSITGQFIDVFAEREAAVWELAEFVYHAMYPISAFGVNLDHSVSFAGVRRLFASKSVAWVNFYGVEGTAIPVGTLVRSNLDAQNYLNEAQFIITKLAAGDVTVSINSAIVGQAYWIRIDNVTTSYTVVTGDTNVDVANHLYGSLIQDSSYITTQDANTIRVYNIEGFNFNFATSTNITIVQLGTMAKVTAEEFGVNEIPANSIDQIITTRTGLDSVNNTLPGQSGRNQETDDELRRRYTQGVYQFGAATIDSIQANLQQNILAINTVNVYENHTDFVDVEGRPPHCIEVVAYGGDSQDIADEIWRVKPAGIETYGATVVPVTDSAGYSHYMRFNRPQLVYVWLTVQVSLYNEESFPPTGDQMIQQIIVDTGNSFGIGKDIIVQRFYGPVYTQVSGISGMIVKVATTADPHIVPLDTDYQPGNYAISVRQLSSFAVDRVRVTVDVPPIG